MEAVQITYDEKGRIETVQAGTIAPRLYQFAYDDSGYLESVTDPLDQTTSYINDEVGRVLTTILPDTREIDFTYDAGGNLTSITPPGKPTHAFDYTPVNLLDTYYPPALNGVPNITTQYAYNLNREIDLITRPDGQTIDFVYDATGKLSTVNLPNAEQYVRTYNPTTGKLATLTSPDGETLSYTYDGSLLKSTAMTGTISGTVNRTYNSDFRVTATDINGANSVSYTYDDDGVPETAGSLDLIPNATTGLLDGTTLNNVTSSNTHNGFGELTAETYSVSSTPVYQVSYTRDDLGRIAERTEMINGETTSYEYEYDLAGRLTDLYLNGEADPTSHYDYDDNGNRVSFSDYRDVTPVVENGTFDDQDRMTSYGNNTDGYTAYEYSANGELESKTLNGQTTNYTYDVLGNLRAVTLPDTTEITYIHDGANRRVGKVVDGALEYGLFYQDALKPIAELNASGALVSRFVYGSKYNTPDYFTSNKADGSTWVTYRIISDHLGSPRLIVNSTTGAIAQRLDYDEFGRVLQDTNPGFQPFGFAGGLYDSDTGLVRFGARDYDAETGRWTAKDPIGFAGKDTNLYGYVFSDPINYIDIRGEGPIGPIVFWISCAMAALAAYNIYEFAADTADTAKSQDKYNTCYEKQLDDLDSPDGPYSCNQEENEYLQDLIENVKSGSNASRPRPQGLKPPNTQSPPKWE
jgi:RHS repeat-associated protein